LQRTDMEPPDADPKPHRATRSAPVTPIQTIPNVLDIPAAAALQQPEEREKLLDIIQSAQSAAKAAGMMAPIKPRRALSEDLAKKGKERHVVLPILPFSDEFLRPRVSSTVSQPSEVRLEVSEDSLSRAMWHTTPVEQVAARMATSSTKGLTTKQAQERFQSVGPNQLQAQSGVNPIRLFLQNLFSFLLILLMVAMILSFATSQYLEGGVLAFIVLFNAILGFVQEYRSEKTIESLKQMSTGVATVFRDGELCQVPSVQLVPGDLITLETGALIPADLRLVEARKLEISESALTLNGRRK